MSVDDVDDEGDDEESEEEDRSKKGKGKAAVKGKVMKGKGKALHRGRRSVSVVHPSIFTSAIGKMTSTSVHTLH